MESRIILKSNKAKRIFFSQWDYFFFTCLLICSNRGRDEVRGSFSREESNLDFIDAAVTGPTLLYSFTKDEAPGLPAVAVNADLSGSMG